MAKKLFDVEIPVAWEILPGDKPDTFYLRLRHKPFEAIKSEGIAGGTTVVLAFTKDMAKDLADDLTGRSVAKRPDRLDS
jgi:hypothetical protein